MFIIPKEVHKKGESGAKLKVYQPSNQYGLYLQIKSVTNKDVPHSMGMRERMREWRSQKHK